MSPYSVVDPVRFAHNCASLFVSQFGVTLDEDDIDFCVQSAQAADGLHEHTLRHLLADDGSLVRLDHEVMLELPEDMRLPGRIIAAGIAIDAMHIGEAGYIPMTTSAKALSEISPELDLADAPEIEAGFGYRA